MDSWGSVCHNFKCISAPTEERVFFNQYNECRIWIPKGCGRPTINLKSWRKYSWTSKVKAVLWILLGLFNSLEVKLCSLLLSYIWSAWGCLYVKASIEILKNKKDWIGFLLSKWGVLYPICIWDKTRENIHSKLFGVSFFRWKLKC